LAQSQGKELWETEHYFDDDSMANIMKMGQELHDCMVTASMNAYVYWWITYGNGLATSSGTIFKRAYTLGQFAKYIRPGYYRVDATANPATNVNVSAYKGDNKVVIVAVNTGTASVSQNFVLRSGTASQLSSWQTTANSNMAAGQTYQASSGSFTAALPGQSITTFVGALSGSPGFDSGVSASDAGASGVGDAGAGGGSGQGGLSGAGGSTGTGGSFNAGGTGGPSGSGGAAGGTGGTTTHTDGTGAGGSSANGGTPTIGDSSSGCSCTLASRGTGTKAHSLGRGLGALFGLCGLSLVRRRRRSAR
jgi:hypothetical protein